MQHQATQARQRPLQLSLWLLLLLAIALGAALGLRSIRDLLGAAMTESIPKNTLRVLTWNIGKLYLRWDSRAADADLAHVAGVIRRLNPHVVALQELRGPAQLGRLLALLGPGWRGKIPEDRYDRRAALLVRLPATFHPITTSTGRTAQAATLTLPGGSQLAVVSLHLDAFEASRRLLQAEEILAGARRLNGEHLLLAGDFNFDAAVAARGSTDHDLYRFLAQTLQDAGAEAGATTVISRRLDYVFYRSTAIREATARVLRDQRVRIMDHDPLLVELRLGPSPRS